MEGARLNETDPKENSTPPTEDAPKFGRRQHRQVSSIEASDAQPKEAQEAAKAAPTQEKWVDDIVADVDAIPEMADANDNNAIANLLSSTPTFKTTNSIQSLKELDGEIGLQLSANSEGIDLSLLTRVMFPHELLVEPDVAWKMDLLMSEIASEAQIKKDSRLK